MPKRTYDAGVFIGRFQPLHIGHTHIIDQALKQVDKLIVVVGSSTGARTIKNPFTYEERKRVIETAYRHDVAMGRLVVVGMPDEADDDAGWAEGVEELVRPIVAPDGGLSYVTKKIALAGYGKDASSFYLKLFPEWANIQISSQKGTLNSTDIRRKFFEHLPMIPHDVLPKASAEFLSEFRWLDVFGELCSEFEYYANYPRQYGPGPFLTGDSIIRHRGDVLLVTRGKVPGQGKLAMPGGFRNLYERLEDAALRELREETGLDLLQFTEIEHSYLVDTPYRSLRGDVLTWVIAATLPDDFDRSIVKAADDAAALGWFDFSQLTADQFFDDHWQILNSHFIHT